MGACATKPGDLKVKGEAPAPLVVDDAAAAPLVVSEEKAKADAVPAAAEADPADVGRRRSLSDLLKQDAETSDGEAGQEAEKVGAVEPAASDAGAATMGAQAPVQEASVPNEPDATTADEVKDDAHGDGTADELKADQHGGDDVQAVEEEKRVDPGSVQVAVPPPDADAAAPSAEESKVADDASSA